LADQDRSGTFGLGFALFAVGALIALAMITGIGRVWRSQWSEESARRAGLFPRQLDGFAESAASFSTHAELTSVE